MKKFLMCAVTAISVIGAVAPAQAQQLMVVCSDDTLEPPSVSPIFYIDNGAIDFSGANASYEQIKAYNAKYGHEFYPGFIVKPRDELEAMEPRWNHASCAYSADRSQLTTWYAKRKQSGHTQTKLYNWMPKGLKVHRVEHWPN